MSQERVKDALELLYEIEFLKEDYENSGRIGNYVSYYWGKVYFLQKDYSAAERHLASALSGAELNGDYLAIMAAHQMLTKIYATNRHFEKAYEHQRAY